MYLHGHALHLHVFDVFTLFVYMFTLIYMALPQPATRLVSPTTNHHSNMQESGVQTTTHRLGPGKFTIFSYLTFLTNFFICF